DIELHLGPFQQQGPDDLLKPIIEFIDSARRRQRLMIAVQEIDHRPIAEAIIRARKRGAIVDLVLEHDYLLSKKIPNDPFIPSGNHEENRFLFNAILRATVDVKADFNNKIFHQKFMVLGNRVLTGSTNFTTTGVTKNLNHIVVVNDAEVANQYKKEFKEIQQGRFGKLSIDRDEKPKYAKVSGTRVKVLFAPDHAPEMEIMKTILKAKKRIDFAIFTFSKSSGIDEALIAAADRGVKVKGVLDNKQANQKWAATIPLINGNVDICVAGNRGGLGKVHHKMMVIDDTVSIFGSFNYTGPANLLNDENILVVGDTEEEDNTAKLNQTHIAKSARKEIDRIVTDFGRPIT
ncbi:MAG: phospholipase D-like domain-containing protein, partial [Bacteroidota bacterium]